MSNKTIYLDNCTFNRPFDDQTQLRISLETQAKLYIQALIKDGMLDLVYSYVCFYENYINPFENKKLAIFEFSQYAKHNNEIEIFEPITFIKYWENYGG